MRVNFGSVRLQAQSVFLIEIQAVLTFLENKENDIFHIHTDSHIFPSGIFYLHPCCR